MSSSTPPPYPPPHAQPYPPPHAQPYARPYAPPLPPLPLLSADWLGHRFWRRPGPGGRAARPAVLVGVVLVGIVTALTLPAPAGLQWTLIVALVTGTAIRAARRPLGWPDRWTAGLVVALGAVAAVRTSGNMIALCLLAALGLGGLLALGGRTWPSVLLTPPALLVTGIRSLPWAWRGARTGRLPRGALAWVRGLVVAAVLLWICGGLLASADGAFAGLLTHVVPTFEPAWLPQKLVLGALAAAITLAIAFAAALPPRWRVLRIPRRGRPVAEWLLPVAAVDGLLAAFLAVQAAVLFDAYPAALAEGDATPAERARQGFGQLVAVTLVVVLLLGWAARRCDPERPRHRRLLVGAGGTLLVLALVVVASALRRLWLYEGTFGWTVLRLDVGVFEVWLGAVILLTGLAWAVRRTSVVPRLVVGSAAVVLLGLGVAGPDAVVASWNVDRFQRTGKIDLGYLHRLSDDAVPALGRLPERERRCVLDGRPSDPAPWYAANVSRLRAQAVLHSLGYPTGRPDPRCWDDEPGEG